MPDMKSAIQLETQLQRLIRDLQNQIKTAVANITNPDIQTQLGGNCATVSLRSVLNNRTILDADYYLPQAQARAVSRRLRSCKTVTDLQAQLLAMTQNQSVTIGRETVPLHPATIQVLQDVLNTA